MKANMKPAKETLVTQKTEILTPVRHKTYRSFPLQCADLQTHCYYRSLILYPACPEDIRHVGFVEVNSSLVSKLDRKSIIYSTRVDQAG